MAVSTTPSLETSTGLSELALALARDAEPLPISALTASMARGDEGAWRLFHRDYFGRLHRYLIVLQRGDEDAAAELVQQTCLRAVRHVRRFDSEEVFWSWLTCLARCAAADEARKKKRRLAMFEKFAHWQEMRRSGYGDGDSGLRMANLNRCLAELKPEDRALVEGKYFERQSYAELAAEFDLSSKAVESRLGRLRAKLRSAMESGGGRDA